MAWRGLTRQQWEAIRIHLPQPKVSRRVDARAWRIAAVSRASSGFFGPAPNGASCPAGMAAPAPVGDGSSGGKKQAYGSSSGGASWPNSTTRRRFGGMSALPMAASSPRKRGAQGRHDQAREGDKVDGFGRWRGYSAGSILGRGVPGGSHAPRDNARHGRDRPPWQTWPTPQAARAADRGPRL
jgi:hypothetical protein